MVPQATSEVLKIAPLAQYTVYEHIVIGNNACEFQLSTVRPLPISCMQTLALQPEALYGVIPPPLGLSTVRRDSEAPIPGCIPNRARSPIERSLQSFGRTTAFPFGREMVVPAGMSCTSDVRTGSCVDGALAGAAPTVKTMARTAVLAMAPDGMRVNVSCFTLLFRPAPQTPSSLASVGGRSCAGRVGPDPHT